MNFKNLICALAFTFILSEGTAAGIVEENLADHFASRNVEGCFVVRDMANGITHVWNTERAETRFRPASTFKIPNAIIGLETGAVRDIEEVIPYGGTKELMPAWEKDMNLRDAMRVSNVAVFHQLAKRIGLPAIRHYMSRFSYGNENVGANIDRRFWLEGPLKISPLEQVEFLANLATGKLNLQEETGAAIQELILFKTFDGAEIYAKTGWVGPDHPQIGWWVGWVRSNGTVYPFAVNIDIHSSKDAKERIPIGLACLNSLGIIDHPEM